MWSQKDTYPLLKKIEDDNEDGFISFSICGFVIALI